MKKEQDIKDIHKSLKSLNKVITKKLSHIDNYERIFSYTLNELNNIDSIIKVCARCGKQFIPSRGQQTINKYCSHECLYDVTRKKLRNQRLTDPIRRNIDLLRKAIYQRKYTAKMYNKVKDLQKIDKYNDILSELADVSSKYKKGDYTAREVNIKVEKLRSEYLYIVYE